MVYREIWEKHALMSFSKMNKIAQDRRTFPFFSQIALETILLPILI